MCHLRAICVSFGCVLSPPYPLADSTRLSARCARPDGSQIASRYLRPPPPSPQHNKKRGYSWGLLAPPIAIQSDEEGGGSVLDACPNERSVAAPHRATATRSKGLDAASLPIVVASTA